MLSGEETLFVHNLKQWQAVEVGNTATHVRFGLRKFPLALVEGESADQTSQVFVQYEIPPDYEVVEKFSNDHFKGVKLKLKQLKSKDVNEFYMS